MCLMAVSHGILVSLSARAVCRLAATPKVASSYAVHAQDVEKSDIAIPAKQKYLLHRHADSWDTYSKGSK